MNTSKKLLAFPRGTHVLLGCLAAAVITAPALAQRPMGRNFGFGLILLDPTGGTINYWFNNTNSFDADIGGESFFGETRLDADYYWHFNAFRSNIVGLYAGPGIAIGFGTPISGYWYVVHGNEFFYRTGGGPGFGIRGLVGVSVVPVNTPLEIFLQLGPLIGISPAFGTAFDVALGIRFYP